MSRNYKLEKLQNGISFDTRETGNSMIPLIYSRQLHRLEPVGKITDIKVGDIVYCKVKGRFYTHLVKKTDDVKGCLISNRKGKENGWTKAIYGKVVKIYDRIK